ncbi:DUF4174 domain-containing protein [Pseudomonas rhizoryzae]|uniref:DUF4174 domain-containing protein n=1 Tax=Pseudomonas rhizoryzae TaxID=2571129 RepID=UPI0007364EAD|nr:DUF4174 domain-containing protein [Pseudomonas rhizoryzae]KTT30515.1 hypothetical protein SB9_20315 [Pseudomonas psychrotolerans]KTT52906.1 hypothetical protein SB11R_00780 [Pseudomonas psychrotolerans]KTT54886.1 hypothetical protein SB8_17400 [Pseudomonas psychrotolerans]KTT66705.1 hypothetical protein NS383_05155 [Pseudomonas psychrotolerans]KTT78064.1 hypothetical protein SB18R_05240 [Pseudomonas psychrotolerans]
MKILSLVGVATTLLACLVATAQAADNPLDAERWKTRPLILVAPTANDPQVTQLRAELAQPANREAFVEREMVLYTVVGDAGSRNDEPLRPEQTRALLKALDARAGQPTTLYLVGKDGGVKVREEQGWSLKALFGTIDRMPMRR